LRSHCGALGVRAQGFALRPEGDGRPLHPCYQVSRGRLSSGGVWGNAPRLVCFCFMGWILDRRDQGASESVGWLVVLCLPWRVFLAAVLFFCDVNLVLVRSWARRTTRTVLRPGASWT
jgi:hypothetical protein